MTVRPSSSRTTAELLATRSVNGWIQAQMPSPSGVRVTVVPFVLMAGSFQTRHTPRPVGDAPAPPPPPGFVEADIQAPFFKLLGPLWTRRVDGVFEMAITIDERHLNGRGQCHGGLLAAFCDIALVRSVARSVEPPMRVAT